MLICAKCYKKLQRQMFSPFDYETTKDGLISTCCNVKAKRIDGREYHQTVKVLKEEAKLLEWGKKQREQQTEAVGG